MVMSKLQSSTYIYLHSWQEKGIKVPHSPGLVLVLFEQQLLRYCENILGDPQVVCRFVSIFMKKN